MKGGGKIWNVKKKLTRCLVIAHTIVKEKASVVSVLHITEKMESFLLVTLIVRQKKCMIDQ